jgi:hypothetical protein
MPPTKAQSRQGKLLFISSDVGSPGLVSGRMAKEVPLRSVEDTLQLFLDKPGPAVWPMQCGEPESNLNRETRR